MCLCVGMVKNDTVIVLLAGIFDAFVFIVCSWVVQMTFVSSSIRAHAKYKNNIHQASVERLNLLMHFHGKCIHFEHIRDQNAKGLKHSLQPHAYTTHSLN